MIKYIYIYNMMYIYIYDVCIYIRVLFLITVRFIAAKLKEYLLKFNIAQIRPNRGGSIDTSTAQRRAFHGSV